MMAMSGLAGCREWLREEVRRIVGVATADGLLYFAGLEKTAAGWQVACLESVLFAPEEERAASIAEKTAVLLARSGWEEVPVVLALPSEDVYAEEMQLPALSTRELAQTAHWEMAAREPFGGAPLLTSYAPLTQGGYEVAAVAAEEAEAYRRAFAAAGVRLWAMAAPPASFRLLAEADRLCWQETSLPLAAALLEADGTFRGWDERFSRALYGAAVLVQVLPGPGRTFPFATVRLSGFNLRRIAGAAVCFAVSLLLLVTGADIYRLYTARQEARQLQAELAVSRGEMNRMEDFHAEEAWIARRDDALRSLSASSPPAAAVLSFLGTRNVAGVYLTELSLQPQQSLQIKGEAVTYDALADYLAGFEAQADKGGRGAALTGSTRHEGGIGFIIEVPLVAAEAESAATVREGEEAAHASLE